MPDGTRSVLAFPLPRGDADEAALIARCREGDEDAWAQVYRLHARRLARFLHTLVWTPGDVDDLVQQVFLSAFDGISRFRGESHLGTWLFGIATHVAERHVRGLGRRRVHLEVLARWEAGQARAAPDSLDGIEARERLRAVFEAVEGLDFKYRAAWTLHDLEGVEIPEVAAALDVPVNTARTWLFRARQRIAERVGGRHGAM